MSKKLEIRAIKSKIITPKDDLVLAVIIALGRGGVKDGDVLIITSKVLAVTQGRIAKLSSDPNSKELDSQFKKLVEAEADQLISWNKSYKNLALTVKEGIFIANSGIDLSNSKPKEAILWPKAPFKSAQKICIKLKKHYKIKKLGVLISDSCCVPLRSGVFGVTLAYAGFEGVNDLRGKKDLYGNKLKVTKQAIADQLATAAHLVMGEAGESTPFVLIKNAPVKFTNKKPSKKSLQIDLDQCLFKSLY